jgi:ABC-2 type transport system permease protein
MNASANALPEQTADFAGAIPPTRTFYWSVRRELWENKSLYVAPLVLAAVILVAIVIGLIAGSGVWGSVSISAQVSDSRLRGTAIGIFTFLSMLMSFNMAIVALFYTLDALHGERKDRSVLFWKSLPVSDTTTVLSKAFVSAIVAPTIGFVVMIALYIAILVVGTVALAVNGGSALALLTNARILELAIVGLYLIVTGALWYAPVTAWLLFVSSWARRTPFLWAVMPVAGVVLLEYVAFGTQRISTAIGERFSDDSAFDPAAPVQFANKSVGPLLEEFGNVSVLSLLDPVRLLSHPGLWVGLAIAGALVAASIWMRRYREPL